MRVLISAHKDGSDASPTSAGDERTPFLDVLQQATVLMLACSLNPATKNLISASELGLLRPETVVVNISRGGLVDERAMLEALQSKRLWGYGTDVFEVEPAGSAKDSVLLSDNQKGLNIVMTPHLAWNSETTKKNIMDMVQTNLKSWLEGRNENRVV